VTSARAVLRSHVLVALLYAVLAFLCFAPALIDPAHRFIGVGTDPLEKMWFLSWAPHALTHHQSLLYTSTINYPSGVNMMWNNSTLLIGVLLAPVTALFGPVVAFNVAMYAAVVASAWCGYWSISRLVVSRLGATAGGLIYGFSPYMMGQSLGHLTLLVMVYPPVVMVLFHEIAVLQRHRWWVLGLLLGVASAAQLFISEEVLASSALAVIIGMVVLAILSRRQVTAKLPYLLRATLLGVVVAAVLSGWALWYQFTGPDQVHQTLQAFGGFVTDPLGFVVPTANQLIAPSFLVGISQHFRGNPAEWDAYLGVPLVCALGWAVWRYWGTALVKVVACTAVGIAVLSLGPYVVIRGHEFPIPLPWLLTEHVPLLKNLLPNRFMAEVYLLAGVVVAYVLCKVTTTSRSGGWRVGIIAFAAGLLLIPALPRPTTAVPAATIVSSQVQAALRAGGVVLPSPFGTSDDAAAMLIQAQENFAFAMPGGYIYAPNLPPVAQPSALAKLDGSTSAPLQAAALATPAGRARALGLLRVAHIETIVVLAESDAARFRSFWTALLGAPAITSQGVAIWTDVGAIAATG
jgi:hypothetical protein